MSGQTLQDELRHRCQHSASARDIQLMACAADRIDELERKLAEAQKDQGRLDFMIEQDAFIVWQLFDSTFKRCQVMTQDEDEEYAILSGDEKSFDTPRQAIDAAIEQQKAEK